MLGVIRTQGMPILAQLQLEEALLRADDQNWCLINEGTLPSIVLGISNKWEEHLDLEKLQVAPLPIIRRFSGGGSVVVSPHTYLATFICNTADTGIPCYPEAVLRWGEGIYKSMIQHEDFYLCENDYVIGTQKCGGNAQYFRKQRWLLHTSFLWDFHPEQMSYLKHPPRMPRYRRRRSHEEFLCRLKEWHPSLSGIGDRLVDILRNRFGVKEYSLNDVQEVVTRPHRKATTQLVECKQKY